MIDKEEWGPWIEHNCAPVAALQLGTIAEMVSRYGIRGVGPVVSLDPKLWANVLRFRIRKPRGLTILENLLADLPAPGSKDVPVLVPDGVV